MATATQVENNELTWEEFETMVGVIYRHHGYAVTETENGSDGGVDLELRCDNRLLLVQCKHWEKAVGVKVARELAGVVFRREADAGILVTKGEFTSEVVREWANTNISLINGRQLRRMAAEAAGRPDLAPSIDAAPKCPNCPETMVRRIASKGRHCGNEFWGCSTFPECWGKREMLPSDQA